jgi:hypothetical protein
MLLGCFDLLPPLLDRVLGAGKGPQHGWHVGQIAERDICEKRGTFAEMPAGHHQAASGAKPNRCRRRPLSFTRINAF